ncbi:MAG: sigma-70 family RNA polymerase sigma factor [Acidobacteria bacterium]|nr:sigma-70 family RNA polymerase sigma factor [Acidobacteriota bacterium]
MGGYGEEHGALGDDNSCEAAYGSAPLYEDETSAASVERDGEDGLDPFHAELELALNLAYPELLDRVRSISAADWHRKHSTEVELAHGAVVAAMQTIRRTRSIPDDLVGYLVTTVQNLASRDWGRREVDPLENSRPLLIGVVEDGSATTETEDRNRKKSTEESDEAVIGIVLHAELDEDKVSSDPISSSAQNLGLTAAVDRLPARQRQVLLLYADRGRSCTQRELAEEIGMTEKNFQMTLARAGKTVCKLLKETGFNVSDAPRWRPVGLPAPKK